MTTRKKVVILRSLDDELKIWDVVCPCCQKVYGKTTRKYFKREIIKNKGQIKGNKILILCLDCRVNYSPSIDHTDNESLYLYNLDTRELWGAIAEREAKKQAKRNRKKDN